MDHTSDSEAFLRATAWDVPDAPANSTHKPMPLVTAISSLPVLVTLMTLPPVGVVIATAQVANSICAVLGAIIASVLTLIEARKKDRSMSHTISVFLGTASVGSFLPGLIVQLAVHRQWIAPDTATAFGWEAWAFGGLVLGMNAWWILHGINRWLQRRAETYFDKP